MSVRHRAKPSTSDLVWYSIVVGFGLFVGAGCALWLCLFISKLAKAAFA